VVLVVTEIGRDAFLNKMKDAKFLNVPLLVHHSRDFSGLTDFWSSS